MIIPCKDCVCLPICRGQYLAFTENLNEPPYSGVIRLKLQSKCSILNNYIYYNDDNQVNRAINFHDFMKNGISK